MYGHIRDAMKLNQERKPQYAALTADKSIAISDALINFERVLMAPSLLADLVALPYQWMGSRIVCAEYISMSKTPVFQNRFAAGAPRLEDFRPRTAEDVIRSFEKAIEDQDFLLIAAIADKQVKELEQEPRFNCMMKHFLESIRRIAGLAPTYMHSTFISRQTLKGHLDSLKTAADIDLMAAPVQALGVPIICQDVPAIPPA